MSCMTRFRVDFYHADRTAAEKARVHREWSAGRIHLICATIAFGMGKKDRWLPYNYISTLVTGGCGSREGHAKGILLCRIRLSITSGGDI